MEQHFLPEIRLGQRAEITSTITDQLIHDFAKLSLDTNPLHCDGEYVARTFFKKPIIHGAYLASQISAVLGTKLPGGGTIYISQSLSFLAPAFSGDVIRTTVEVVEIAENKDVHFRTWCENHEGKKIVEGIAVVRPPKIPLEEK